MATLYTARFIGPEILELGKDNLVSCAVYRDGDVVEVEGTPPGKISVWNASGVLVVDDENVDVSEDGIAEYTITSSVLASQTPSDGWRFEWSVVCGDDTVAVTFCRDGSLVYRRLYPVITDADLLRAHSDLARRTPPTESSYQEYVDESFAQIESKLINTGRRPWLIMSPSALRSCHLYLALSLVFRDFATGGSSSPEWELAERYEQKYQDAWKELTFPERAPTTGADANPGVRKSAALPYFLCGRG